MRVTPSDSSPPATSADPRPGRVDLARGAVPLGTGALRLALAGGGTGGHVVPGLHLLQYAFERSDEVPQVEDLVWFQTGRRVEERALERIVRTGDEKPDDLEEELAKSLGLASVERVVLALEPEGGGAPSRVALAWRSAPAVRVARSALVAHRTRVLLGLGGFATLPAVLAARSLGIPVALLEVNAASGAATRFLRPLARRVLHAWPSTMPRGVHPGGRDRLVGPPLAPDFTLADSEADAEYAAGAARKVLGFEPDAPLVVVIGGSQGAQALNRFVREHLNAFLAAGVSAPHQTGPGRLDEALPPASRYRPVEYLREVDLALSAATVVLCRGGASTLAEVAGLRVPAFVVPYPHHRDQHQARNAAQLGDGVRTVEERDLGVRVRSEILALAGTEGREQRARMRRALRTAVPGNGARLVLEELSALTSPE